jgi:hypothetical protein
MATSHAETGDIAAKAGATAEGDGAATATTDIASAPATGVGAAEVAGPPAPEAPKEGEKAADSSAKKPKSDDKKDKSTKKVADAAKKLVDTALDEVGKDEKPKGLKKIKVLRSHPDYAYHPGEEGELPTEKAEFLIKGGFAQATTS